VDHVVYAVPELDPAIDALTEVLGQPPKRRAKPRGPQGPEMAFFTVGEGFIEVVASGRPPGLWGIAFSTPDLDACVETVRAAGGPIGDPKPAVQGGRIASVWKEHVGWGVAVMEPPKR
jgi:catechol 2,3-dioxygenase-like lactoylglutathione lyase family enzyme